MQVWISWTVGNEFTCSFTIGFISRFQFGTLPFISLSSDTGCKLKTWTEMGKKKRQYSGVVSLTLKENDMWHCGSWIICINGQLDEGREVEILYCAQRRRVLESVNVKSFRELGIRGHTFQRVYLRGSLISLCRGIVGVILGWTLLSDWDSSGKVKIKLQLGWQDSFLQLEAWTCCSKTGTTVMRGQRDDEDPVSISKEGGGSPSKTRGIFVPSSTSLNSVWV